MLTQLYRQFSLCMFRRNRRLVPLEDRGPLRVMFVITCMPVGGAERLLVDLTCRLDRQRMLPELCCLKYLGPLGEELARQIRANHGHARQPCGQTTPKHLVATGADGYHGVDTPSAQQPA